MTRITDDQRSWWELLHECGPRAMTEGALAELAAGHRTDVTQEAQERAGVVGSGALAVVPVMGPLTHRPRLFGGMSYQALASQVRRVSQHPEISTIVFDIDSPGGAVAGLDELASAVRTVPQRTVAVANTLMASAAYYVASVADEIVVAPSALVGSIGTVAMHVDISKQLEQIGIRPTFISAGKGKTAGNPFEPLSDDARIDLQEIVDNFYAEFVTTVAKGRQAAGAVVTTGIVRERWGAKIFTAEEAVRLGVADRVATLDQVVGQLAGRPAPRSNATRSTGVVQSDRGTRTAAARRRARQRLALA